VIESFCKGGAATFGVKLDHLFREFDSGPGALARDAIADAACVKAGVESCVFGGHTICDLAAVKQNIASKKYKPPTSMAMIQKLVKFETGSSDLNKLERVPLPKPAPTKLGNLPASVAKAFSGKCDSKKTPFIPSIADLYPKEKPHPLSELQFPGGETEALRRLEAKVSAPGQGEYVRRFEKPMTSSTNVRTKSNGGDDWTAPDTTGLSPYIMMGCLSVRQLWHAVQKQYDAKPGNTHSQPPTSLHGQLLFREMFYVLSACTENWDKPAQNVMCKDVRWGGGDGASSNGAVLTGKEHQARLLAWQEGKTGYPYIDALMRQLKATGWMHHLGRHAVSCFLTRGDLWVSWTHGRDWFDKQLLDGDWALNNGNWMQLAGVAPFSPPWFRVYSPTPPVTGKQSSLNAEQSGDFVRFWIPELKKMPTRYIYNPSAAPLAVQQGANCIVGKDYPAPIVPHSSECQKNLDLLKENKGPREAAGTPRGRTFKHPVPKMLPLGTSGVMVGKRKLEGDDPTLSAKRAKK